MPSSVVADFSYDPKLRNLRITYTSGMVYDYKAVPESVYEEMKSADSKGQFLNYHIKGKYKFKKVSSPL